MDRAILEIRARIGSARLLLDRLASCPTERASASRTQCTALVDAVGRAVHIHNADKAALGEVAQQVQWEASDAATIARAFSGDMATGGRVRQQLQYFQNIHNFFLESEWACLVDSKATMTVRLDVIIGRCISLTLRNPNEWTFKHMTAILIVLGEDPNHLHTLPAQQKSEMMSHVKQQFRAATRRAGTAQEHILKLPPSFSELQRQWPQVASSACAGQEPCQSPVDVRLFHSVGQSFRCRGHVNAAPVPTLSLSRPGTNDVGILDHMQKFAMAMVQGMAKMQEQQHRIFESFGTSAAASPHSFHSRAEFMPALMNGSRADVAPTVHRSSSLDSLRSDSHAAAHADSTLGSAAAGDSQIALRKADGATLGSAAAGGSQIVLHNTDGKDASIEQTSTAVDGTFSLLNALDEREREKALQAKAERGKALQAKAERTPVKRCRGKTPAQPVPCKPQKMDTPEKQPKTQLGKKRPHFSLETNRGQFMCRTGIAGPGSTYKISFGAGKQFKSESAALQAAQRWVREQCALRGFE